MAEHIGQRFILTLPETNDAATKAWLAKNKPAGVMLLAGHMKNRTKTAKLCSMLQAEAKKLHIPPLIIATDWEGGIVSRPSEAGGFTSIPSPWALARVGISACFSAGYLVGSQMKSVGINMDFAPSLDLFGSRVLATRCFDASPNKTAACGLAFAQGLMAAGVCPVIKHFPGLGLESKADTHLEEATINTDDQTLATQTQPFLSCLQAGAPAVMVTHAVYPQYGKLPLTRNPRIPKLFEQNNPDAVVITDDFCMLGAFAKTTQENAIIQALTAGYHLIIFSGSPETQTAILEKAQNLLDTATKDLPAAQATAIARIKKQYCAPVAHQAIPQSAETSIAQHLAKQCVPPLNTIADMHFKKIALITVDLPLIRPPEKWFINKEKSYLHTALKERGLDIVDEFIINAKEKDSPEQVTDIVKILKSQPDTFLVVQTIFYADNTWNTTQEAWLKNLAPLASRMLVVSLGHPFEQTISSRLNVVNIGSFHKPLLDRLADLIATAPLQTGADLLIANPAQYLSGKSFGLLCHKCSTTSASRFLPDVLKEWADEQADTKLTALFSPEHGLEGTQEAFASIASEKKSRWNCPVHSLHGAHKKPTPSMLKGLDCVLIDLQEVGLRCYTYLSTLKLMLEACAEKNIPVIVLDRPNPLKEWGPQGPRLEPDCASFVGKLAIPFMHGTSIGTLAQQEWQGDADQLTVLPCTDRANSYPSWSTYTPPSPNLASIEQLLVYPLTVFLEGTNYSEGRGTDYPFLQIGAPWVDKTKLARTLNNQKLPGLYFQPVSFAPKAISGAAENPKHRNQLCNGVFIHVLSARLVEPIKSAQTILTTLFQLYPSRSQFITWGKHYGLDLLAGTSAWRTAINQRVYTKSKRGHSLESASWQQPAPRAKKQRRQNNLADTSY
jgi:uncharacterized protein YbbC (DUF1343 family)/beta-glucosidase-like glycosyl hydrolase